MPRRRRTQSGDPALPVQSVPGRRYGEGVASAQLQRNMPTPNRQISVPIPTSSMGQQTSLVATPAGTAQPIDVAPTSIASVQQVNRADQFANQLAAAQNIRGAGLLQQPTMRMNEPVTTGLSTGPGAGPEVLQPIRTTPTGRFYQRISQVTGDPYFEQLARRAGIL